MASLHHLIETLKRENERMQAESDSVRGIIPVERLENLDEVDKNYMKIQIS